MDVPVPEAAIPNFGEEDESDDDADYFEREGALRKLSEYSDPLSSGRKEAARIAPIKNGMVCEWAWLAEAGGGVEPIIGCPGHPASDIHHGPDKNTMRNTLGTNLHRVCDWCHNTWHARNDPYYGPRPTFKNPDGTDQIDNQGRPKVDASQPFLPLPEHMDRLKIHNPLLKADEEEVFAEEKRRRDEMRKHGNG